MYFVNKHGYSPAVHSEFHKKLYDNLTKVDRAFVWLLASQWLACILLAIFASPHLWKEHWDGAKQNIWTAILFGGALSLIPALIVRRKAGTLFSRQVISACQILFSSLLIHLSAGRTEMHFHVFMSMALLIAYRDRSVFILPVLITAIDHTIRGAWWPQSIFGTSESSILQPIEHACWLLAETAGLCYIVGENLRQWLSNASLQHDLQVERDLLEKRVSERTRTLKCLQQFREEILNSIDSSICILDSRGRIVFINEKWAQFSDEYGVPESCGLGSSYLESCALSTLGSPEFIRIVASNIKLIAIGESDSFCTEYSYKLRNELRHYSLSITPVALDGELGVAIVHVDVTHLKRAERRASALAKLLQESPDEVLIAQVDNNQFIEANEGASNNTGYSRDELLKMELMELFEDKHAIDVRSALFGISSNPESVARFESQIRRKDGSTYPGRLSLHRTHFEDTDVWVMFITDLTEQKQLEAKLTQAQKLESLGTLAAGIAHEINTPMQCVVGNFEFLQNSFNKLTALSDRMVELLDASAIDWSAEREQLQKLRKEYKYDFLRKQTPMALEEAADSSRRIVSIVRAMKAMSHPGTEDAVQTDIHELIQDASTISRNRWKYVAEMTFNFSQDVPKIFGFPAELSQVFVNLFVNSTDAIIERLGSEPSVLGLISVDTRVAGDNVIIRVRDTGNGIPESIRKKIFDPFFTTKPVGKGTGQGLSITHSVIVNKHNGSISVNSEVGIGTVFTLALPISKNDPSKKKSLPPVELNQSVPASVNTIN